MKATSIQYLKDGKAFWYGAAATSNGPMFTKMPFVDPTGGHESNWMEFIALRLARNVGLPVLDPHPVEVDARLVHSSYRERTFWDHGNRFAGTSYQQCLAPGRGYDELGDDGKALLYAFDNFLYYTDRARPTRPPQSRQDCWLGDDGHPVILDWDFYGAPTRAQPGVGAITWDPSKFLGAQLRAAEIERACRAISALTDDVLQDTVTIAETAWDRVDAPAVHEWLIGRRDNLLSSFAQEQAPPWMP